MSEIRTYTHFKKKKNKPLLYVKGEKTRSGLTYTACQQILIELWIVFVAVLVAIDSTEKFKT